jgi:peptidyl-prolyl cis-trans isomerase SurA
MRILLNILFLFAGFNLIGQTNRILVDEILAVVGDQPILRSELEAEVAQMTETGEIITTAKKCEIFEMIVQKKMLLHQAALDSIPVSDEQVDDDLNKRIRFFATQLGGEKNLEEYLGKSIVEYKKEMRPKIKQQLLIRSMEGKIMGDIKVSPREVKSYFESLHKDSIPLIEAEFEVAQLVIKPKVSDEAKEFAYLQLEQVRQRILNGENFAKLARYYSEDEGSKINGGDLGEFGRGDMVPEFERVAYKLKEDSISEIIETEYGYHIIQLLERRGEKVRARHILIMPKLTSFELNDAALRADSLVQLFKDEKITFCEMIKKHSDDNQTKGNCGYLSNFQTGSNKIVISEMDKEMAMIVSRLKPGEISEPVISTMPDRSKVVRVFYLKSEIPPHKAGLENDYPRIQLAAMENKSKSVMDTWVDKKLKSTYVYINPNYLQCDFIDIWNIKSQKP